MTAALRLPSHLWPERPALRPYRPGAPRLSAPRLAAHSADELRRLERRGRGRQAAEDRSGRSAVFDAPKGVFLT